MKEEVLSTVVNAAGRVVIPAKIRQRLHLKEGDVVIMKMRGNSLVLESAQAALLQAQDFFKSWHYQPGGTLISEELLAERRAEAAQEGY